MSEPREYDRERAIGYAIARCGHYPELKLANPPSAEEDWAINFLRLTDLVSEIKRTDQHSQWIAKNDEKLIERLVVAGFLQEGRTAFKDRIDVTVALECLMDKVDELQQQLDEALDKREATSEEWAMVGVCGVDSGTMRVAMGDPCYDGWSFDKSFSSGLGDGGYGVFQRKVTLANWGRRTAEVRIIFLDEGIDGRDSVLRLLREEATEKARQRLERHKAKVEEAQGADSHLD